MNLHQEQNLIRAKLEREVELKKIKLLARELFELPQNAEPSDKQIEQVYKELQVLKLDSNTTFDEYNDRRAEWIDLLNDLELPLNAQDNETPLDSDYMYDIDLLQKVSGIKSMINSPEIQSYSQVANYMYLLGIDDWGHIDKIVITWAEVERNILITEVLDIFNSEDIFKSRIDKLPSSKLKDLIDAVTFKVIDPGFINSELGLNDPNANVEANFESLFYNLESRRAQFNLKRSASKEQIENMVRLEEQALTYLQANNELNPNEVLDIKKIQRVLKEKEEYSRLAIDLGIDPDSTKGSVIEELDKLGLTSYIYGVHSGAKIATLPSTDDIEKAIADKDLILEEFRQKITKDPTTPATLTQDIKDLTPIELEKRIKIIERAKKLLIDDENALMNVDNQALAQRYRELGIGKARRLSRLVSPKLVEERTTRNESLVKKIEKRRAEMGITNPGIQYNYSEMSQDELIKLQNEVENAYYALKALGINNQDPVNIEDATLAKGLKLLGFNNRYNNDSGPIIGSDGAIGFSNSISVVNPETLKRRFEEREKLIKDMQEIGKKFDGDAFEIPNLDQTNNKELEKKKKEYKRIGTIGKVAINKKGSDSGIDKVTMKDERRGLKRLGYGFLRRRFHKNIDIDDIKKRAEDLDPAQMWSGAEKQIKDLKKKKDELETTITEARAKGLPEQQIEILEMQKQQYDQALRDGNTKLNEIKEKADPYKRLIEADPDLIKARTYKQMFAAEIDPNDKISYGKLEKKVRHLVRDERKMKRLEGRMKYRLSPFTRGIFARRRISKIEEMKAKAKELGYKDPDQLQKAGFLNRKVLKRIENKKNLINKAEELGLKPELTTAHELNVEKRIYRFGLNRSPGVANVFRKVMNFGNRTLTSNQVITEIDPIKHRQQRFMPKRLAKAFGAPRRAVQKIINPKRVSEGAKVGKGIFKGILEVKTQLEKGIPEKKDGK